MSKVGLVHIKLGLIACCSRRNIHGVFGYYWPSLRPSEACCCFNGEFDPFVSEPFPLMTFMSLSRGREWEARSLVGVENGMNVV